MYLQFTLTMPGNNSWNGKWSGEGKVYAIVRKVSDAKKNAEKYAAIVRKGSFGHNFGDGWFARVSVSEIDAKQRREVLSKSKGFCGYDWMVESILSKGEIAI